MPSPKSSARKKPCRNPERKLGESLAEAELNLKRLRMIEGAVNAGTWEFDIATGMSHWGSGISSLWGLPPQEHHIPLKDFLSRIYPEDRDQSATQVVGHRDGRFL